MTSASIHDDFLNSKRDGTSVAIGEIVDLHMQMTSSYYLFRNTIKYDVTK